MKKFLIILVILVLLCGGGVAGWIYLTGHAGAPDESPPPVASTGPPVYVDFRPLLLPVVGADRVEQMITIKIVIEAVDREAGDRVIAMAPRLNDAFLQALYGTLETRSVMRPNGLVDITLLKARIVEVSRRLMGEGVVNDALVQTVTQRPM